MKMTLTDSIVLINGWLGAFSKEVGIGALSLDDNLCCYIKGADHFYILIKFDQVADDLVLCTYVSDQWVARARCLVELMRWNHEGTRLMGGTLGLCPQHNRVTLTLRKSIKVLDEKRLYNLIQNYIEVAKRVFEDIMLLESHAL